jgi:Uma2 family endonuclease
MGTTSALLTFEEFERLPDQPGKRELVEGELIELPPAEIKHDRSSRRIFLKLHNAVEAAHARGEALELGEVCIESGFKLSSKTWVTPDVSIAYSNQPESKYILGSPAIAIEVVSPANSAEVLDRKTALYFEHGAAEVWRVYRKTRHVDVHTPGACRVIGADGVVTTPLLPGFSMPVKEILGE